MAPRSGAGEAVDVEQVVVEVADAIVKRRPTVGTLLAGRFRIVRFLGHGGHAMVFVAQHVVTHKCYAAKVFEQEAKKSQGSSPSSSQPHARNVSDSVDSKLNSAAYEAANLAEHSHPHMVRLHEYQHCDGWPTMLLELGSLGSLEDVMDALRSRGEYMPESLVATVLAHVILALHELHGANVLHRDVKVANVLISNLLDFKLGDFGVSKHLGQQSETNTFAGTPVYMAPEVLKNQPYSVQSDIFSLGHLCYELCELRRLFNPLTWTTLERDHSQPYPRVDGDQYSEALCDLIAQMLSHEPEHRPTSAQLVASPYVQAALAKTLHTRRRMVQQLTASASSQPNTPKSS